MKIHLVTVAAFLMLSTNLVVAQQSGDQSKVSFGLLGGVNFQNLTGKDASGDDLNNDMVIGYHVGANIQIPIVPEFYFQPGLMFTTKGAKNSSGLITETVKLSYVTMPLDFVYKGLLGNGYVMVGFGPYLGYGVGGSAKFEGDNISLTSDVEFTNTVEVTADPLVPYYKPLDVGANIFVGYEMSNGIFMQLNADLGLVSISPEDKRILNDESNVKNTGFGVSLGYRF